jgi:hypothetical protein
LMLRCLAVLNRDRGTWIAAVVVPVPQPSKGEHVEVVSWGHPLKSSALIAALKYCPAPCVAASPADTTTASEAI